MSKRDPKPPPTLSEMLRAALVEAPSLRGVERATGISAGNLCRFIQGKQTLRLDMAERLAEHFEISFVRNTRQED